MNILFLTMSKINSLNQRGIYTDLLRKFSNEGHCVYLVSPVERRDQQETFLVKEESGVILRVKTLNLHKSNVVEKGIGTLIVEYQYLRGIKKYFNNIKFDLVVYSTPPITFQKVIQFIKKRDNAFAYLLLKDIFPQNAIDMKMMKPHGFFHQYFTKQEKKLYRTSDKIGCMSPANMKFVLEHNPEIPADKVEVNPNSIEPIEIRYSVKERTSIRTKYGLPTDKKILVYGGNLGKPQGLGFLQETISACKNEQAYFLIVGDGTEYPRLKKWFESKCPENAVLFQRLPKDDYLKVLAACDIGLIFLDRNFLIPNFPSRLLSYLEMKKPIIAATDPNTDIGDIIEKNGCGIKVISGELDPMLNAVDALLSMDLVRFEKPCTDLLYNQYLVTNSYDIIMKNLDYV